MPHATMPAAGRGGIPVGHGSRGAAGQTIAARSGSGLSGCRRADRSLAAGADR